MECSRLSFNIDMKKLHNVQRQWLKETIIMHDLFVMLDFDRINFDWIKIKLCFLFVKAMQMNENIMHQKVYCQILISLKHMKISFKI